MLQKGLGGSHGNPIKVFSASLPIHQNIQKSEQSPPLGKMEVGERFPSGSSFSGSLPALSPA